MCANPSKECAKSAGSQGCWHYKRSCSYRDEKRAFSGTHAAGPLVLKFPDMRNNADSCGLFLSEPGYSWNKPLKMANWHMELDVTIDGVKCDQHCVVDQGKGAYLQNYRINLKDHLDAQGSTKKCHEAEIVITTKPIESLEAWQQSTGKQVCAVKPNGKCEPNDEWRRYAIQCDMVDKAAKTCALSPKVPQRKPDTVEAFITNAVAW